MDEKTPQQSTEHTTPGIRTYGSDMADAIRTNEASVIKIALAEQKKREREALTQVAQGTKTSRVFLTLGGLMFIVAAILGVSFVVQQKTKKSLPQEIIRNLPAIVSYDETLFADVTPITGRATIADGINKEISDQAKIGSIRSLFLTKLVSGTPKVITIQELIGLLEMRIPESLLSSLAQTYMIGTYALPETDETGKLYGKQHLFLLFQTTNYNQTYASLLEWEKTILDDMFLLFKIDISDRKIFETQFKDTLIANKDARVLEKPNGTPALYYMFLDKETFIITDTKETLREIGLRLITKNTKPL